jgi:hypothetical protein
MVDVEAVLGTVVKAEVIIDASEEEEGVAVGVAWMSLSVINKASLEG